MLVTELKESSFSHEDEEAQKLLNDKAKRLAEERKEELKNQVKKTGRLFAKSSHKCTVENSNCPMCMKTTFEHPPVGHYRPFFNQVHKRAQSNYDFDKIGTPTEASAHKRRYTEIQNLPC
jgi:hypothetical protein